MAARAATWLAIAIGGAAGALAALASSGSAPTEHPASAITANAAERPSPPPIVAAPAPTASPSSTAEAAPSSSASAAAPVPAASASAKPAAPPPAADLLPLPTTEKLLRQEMHCDQRQAEACIVAARSYESGSAGLTDLEKAAKYRRIALTVWISQCDRNSQVACATLATMYRAGSGVPQSDRNADALVARARELCRFNDAPVCHELPNP